MNNIFIKETKKFYNYINTTHCKDFKDLYKIYYNYNKDITIGWWGIEKKRARALYNLYAVLRNNEFIKIKKYIFRESSEEDEFENWMDTLKNFIDFVFNFSDPLLISPQYGAILVEKTNNINTLTIKHNLFDFIISFEKSNIKKSNSSLFDTITGLDKENNLSFINIKIINNVSNTVYKYNYMENSSLNPENPISEDICDLQLEYVKEKIDKYIYDYMGIVFDNIVNRELNSIDFCIFNSIFIRNNYKEMEEEWLKTMNMESD